MALRFEAGPPVQPRLPHPRLQLQVQEYVGNLLKDVKAIHELTENHVREIQSVIESRMVLEQFHVTPEAYGFWTHRTPVSGVEYDSMTRYIIIKPKGIVREKVAELVAGWMDATLAPAVACRDGCLVARCQSQLSL